MRSRATLRSLADELGLSKNAVSLALKDSRRISAKTRRRVQQLAQARGYRPNPLLSQLMSQVGSGGAAAFRGKLALFNAHADPRALERHPTLPSYLEGFSRRAAQRGYGYDRFWLRDPKLAPRRLIRILETRSIRGAVVIGLMETNRLPDAFREVWERLACAVVGTRPVNPTLSFACADHHDLALQAFSKALERGYRQPALALDDTIDRLVERRFSAGYLVGQQALPKRRRIAPFFDVGAAERVRSRFLRWIERQRPDCLFTLYNAPLRWLGEAGYRIPRDIGAIQLEWRPSSPEIAGMRQRNDLAAAAAVDLVVDQIHRSERGPPEHPLAVLIGANWVDGPSVAPARPAASDLPLCRELP